MMYIENRDVTELAFKIFELDYWDLDLCKELCQYAGLDSDWSEADGDNFEGVLRMASLRLGVYDIIFG